MQIMLGEANELGLLGIVYKVNPFLFFMVQYQKHGKKRWKKSKPFLLTGFAIDRQVVMHVEVEDLQHGTIVIEVPISNGILTTPRRHSVIYNIAVQHTSRNIHTYYSYTL